MIDNTGGVLPGVHRDYVEPALIQPQVAVTSADGAYHFRALPAAIYELTLELAGFQSVKREGIHVVINQTLTVNQQCRLPLCKKPRR